MRFVSHCWELKEFWFHVLNLTQLKILKLLGHICVSPSWNVYSLSNSFTIITDNIFFSSVSTRDAVKTSALMALTFKNLSSLTPIISSLLFWMTTLTPPCLVLCSQSPSTLKFSSGASLYWRHQNLSTKLTSNFDESDHLSTVLSLISHHLGHVSPVPYDPYSIANFCLSISFRLQNIILKPKSWIGILDCIKQLCQVTWHIKTSIHSQFQGHRRFQGPNDMGWDCKLCKSVEHRMVVVSILLSDWPSIWLMRFCRWWPWNFD